MSKWVNDRSWAMTCPFREGTMTGSIGWTPSDCHIPGYDDFGGPCRGRAYQ